MLNQRIKLTTLIILLCSGITFIQAQSTAHQSSEFSIIDPAYSNNTKVPASNIDNSKVPWIYGPAELECWRLQLLMQRKDSAKLKVGYPGVFHKPFVRGSFRLISEKPKMLNKISFRAVGNAKVYINGSLAGSFTDSDIIHTIILKKNLIIKQIQFDLETQNDPIALLLEDQNLSTSLKNWEWKPYEGDWEFASQFPQNIENVPPHRLEDPIIELKPQSVENNLFDFGKELYGYIIIKSQNKPVMNAGESAREALDIETEQKEQSMEMEKTSENIWTTKNPVAFRYLYVVNNNLENISCKAIFYPLTYRGAFACSDSSLTKIWMHSAYTLRLNMHDFLLDGIKRDRLPWAGDLAMSLLVNAHTFSDPELVRRSLVALGRAGIKEKDINGIIDYSLWWIIAQDLYQLYFNDLNHLKQEWGRIKTALHDLNSRSDSNGFLQIEKNSWLFIDWIEAEKWTALQILWWWAQESGAKLAQRLGDNETVNLFKKNAEKLKLNLKKVSWDEYNQIWLSNNKPDSELNRYPNFLAVISGLMNDMKTSGIRALLENDSIKSVGTPYMAGFEVMALSKLGNIEYMLKYVNDYWGGMLNRGATTFWEGYDPRENFEEQYSFYRRLYGKSLCHAWSAGPAAFLISGLSGLEPLEDGWRLFTISPDLGSLDWISVCLPTQYGDITVDVKNKDIRIFIPLGTALKWKDKVIEGPRIFNDKL